MLTIFLLTQILAAALICVTGLSILESSRWWIRVWDFPRPQILVGLVIAAALSLWAGGAAGAWIAAGCGLAAGWQLYRIFPYTWLATPEMAMSGGGEDGQCFRVLSLNVLQTNRNYDATAQLIDRVNPDILLLMETDQGWADALAGRLERYPHVLLRPLDNLYGMILATRLPMRDGQIITDDPDTPAMTAELTIGAQKFRIIALHPRPPVPGQDTEQRDGQIARAAKRAAKTRLPVLTIGDFNDVAWSHTSRLFRRVGGYLDPRIGRGTYATFPARFVMLGWPLDHLFVTPDFAVRSLEVLAGVGSDHLPITAELCLGICDPNNAPPTPATAEDERDVAEIIDESQQAQDKS